MPLVYGKQKRKSGPIRPRLEQKSRSRVGRAGLQGFKSLGVITDALAFRLISTNPCVVLNVKAANLSKSAAETYPRVSPGRAASFPVAWSTILIPVVPILHACRRTVKVFLCLLKRALPMAFARPTDR